MNILDCSDTFLSEAEKKTTHSMALLKKELQKFGIEVKKEKSSGSNPYSDFKFTDLTITSWPENISLEKVIAAFTAKGYESKEINGQPSVFLSNNEFIRFNMNSYSKKGTTTSKFPTSIDFYEPKAAKKMTISNFD